MPSRSRGRPLAFLLVIKSRRLEDLKIDYLSDLPEAGLETFRDMNDAIHFVQSIAGVLPYQAGVIPDARHRGISHEALPFRQEITIECCGEGAARFLDLENPRQAAGSYKTFPSIFDFAIKKRYG
jgi:hypothetical protein